MGTRTTSIRLDDNLAQQIEHVAAHMHMRKNGLIVRAIEEFLERHGEEWMRTEARRQSLRASRLNGHEECEAWERAIDDADWR